MTEQGLLLTFTICGQEFRLRAEKDAAERMRKVARSVEEMVRECKSRGAGGELRAALMSAYELAYELSELKDELARHKSPGVTQTMDRLLARIEKEMRSLQVSDARQTSSDAETKNKPQGRKK